MSDFAPVSAREHLGLVGRGTPAATGSAAAIFDADDADFTRPVPIVAARRLGDSELTVFPVALGAARLATVDDTTAGQVLHTFLQRGGSLVDVTDLDATARSEEVVGAWLSASRPRGLAVALTASVERDGVGASGAARLVRAVEASLSRLRSEHVDVLTLDLRAPGLELEQQLAAAELLVDAGKVRYVAAAGAAAAELLASRVLASEGLPRLTAVRPAWDITVRSEQTEEMRMVAAAQGLAILPDASAASLALLAPAMPQKVLAGWSRAARLGGMVGRPPRPARERAAEALNGRGRTHRLALALDSVSAELGAEPATTQLAWLLAKRGVVAPIVAVTRPEQLETVMAAAAVRLTRAHMLELDRAVESER